MMPTDALTRGIELALDGKFGDALEIVHGPGETRKSSYKSLCVTSIVKIGLTQYSDALTYADEADKISYGNTAHNACRIMAYCGSNQLSKAESVLKDWRIKSADDPLARGEYGILLDESLKESAGNGKIDWDLMVKDGLTSDVKNQINSILLVLKSMEEDSDDLEGTNIEKGDRNKSNEIKLKGNVQYKSKNFQEALELYNEALKIDPSNTEVYNNIAAVYFELKDYNKCIEVCNEAVDISRRIMAEFRIIARSLSRMGKAYMKLEDYDNAVSCFNHSLTELRTDETFGLLKEAKKLKEEKDRLAYLDPQLSEKHREEGNACFRKGLYRDAITHYTEALKRNFNDPRIYSNRAACYIKLMAWREAEKDCDDALKLDPKFVRATIRKAQVLQAKREYIKALDLLNGVMEEDKEGVYLKEVAPIMGHIQEALREAQNSTDNSETLRNAMQNPEVQEIISNPVMQTVLKQITDDPKALDVHMKDPEIARKIRTLIAAGFIQVSH